MLKITKWKTTNPFAKLHCYGEVEGEKVTRVLSYSDAGRLNRIGDTTPATGGYREGDITERFDSVDELIKRAKEQFGEIKVSDKNYLGLAENDIVVVVGR